MSRTQEEVMAMLKEPFPSKQVHWRIGATNKKAMERKTGDRNAKATKGIALAYINSRDVMKRLDDVMGIAGWQNRYPYSGCCEISLLIEGEWITKSNTAGETQVEGVKGQGSDGLKRAATNFGVGRYLYYLSDIWVDLDAYGKFAPPPLPHWALPEEEK